MASMAAFVYFWSSAYEVSGGCATDTLYPSLMRMLATASQPEPSAKAPCTRTTFLICCFTTILLCSKDPRESIDFRCPTSWYSTVPVLRVGRTPNDQDVVGATINRRFKAVLDNHACFVVSDRRN